MWSYNHDSYQNSLMHYGVPGMKWGHKKAKAVPSNTADAWRRMKLAKYNKQSANKKFDKAYRHDNSIIRKLQFDKADNKRSAKDLSDAARKADKADRDYKKAKKAYKVTKKAEKQKIKDIKAKYSKDYLNDKSRVGKVISRMLGTDKIYADIMYDMDKRAKVNKKWRD